MAPLLACSGSSDNLGTLPKSDGSATTGGATSGQSTASSGGNSANGGFSASGGVTSGRAANTGGATTNVGGSGTGGSVGTGGMNQAGGASSTGGAPSSGGAVAAGGAPATGGAANRGGATGVGGVTDPAGGRNTGGTRATGGTSAGGTASSAGGNSAGTGPDCSGGPRATSLPTCVIVPPPSTGDYHQDCVDTINKIRWDCMCLPPLQRWTEGEACADQMAVYDSGQNSAHAGFIAKLCTPGGSAQCECPGWGSVASITQGTTRLESCLAMMWHEVDNPSGEQGHYEAMSTTTYTRVACGINTSTTSVWAVQNYSR
jgi:hypothetical protein